MAYSHTSGKLAMLRNIQNYMYNVSTHFGATVPPAVPYLAKSIIYPLSVLHLQSPVFVQLFAKIKTMKLIKLAMNKICFILKVKLEKNTEKNVVK